MGSLRCGDCVTERRVHRCVRNALKTDIKTRWGRLKQSRPLAPLFSFTPLPLSLPPCPLMILASCHAARLSDAH